MKLGCDAVIRMHRQCTARSATACRKTDAPAAVRPVLYIESGWQRSHLPCKRCFVVSQILSSRSEAESGKICACFRLGLARGPDDGEVPDWRPRGIELLLLFPLLRHNKLSPTSRTAACSATTGTASHCLEAVTLAMGCVGFWSQSRGRCRQPKAWLRRVTADLRHPALTLLVTLPTYCDSKLATLLVQQRKTDEISIDVGASRKANRVRM